MKRAFRVLFQWLMKTFNNKKDGHYYFTNLIEVTDKKIDFNFKAYYFLFMLDFEFDVFLGKYRHKFLLR